MLLMVGDVDGNLMVHVDCDETQRLKQDWAARRHNTTVMCVLEWNYSRA
jgi:hypothetical protein